MPEGMEVFCAHARATRPCPVRCGKGTFVRAHARATRLSSRSSKTSKQQGPVMQSDKAGIAHFWAAI